MAKAASPNFQIQVQKPQNASIEKLNPKEIPVFLSNLSDAKDPDHFSGHHKLSLLNTLVRTHGRNIMPYVSSIMSVMIQSLECSGEHSSASLHHTCYGLTCAIAQYGIDPLVPESEKFKIVTSLCGPLSDSLMSSQKNVASICAFCIQALVESSNWKYASSELVNQICSKVAGALEEEVGRIWAGTHLGLATSLAKQNPLVIEPYARSLITSGLLFLTDGGPQMKVMSVEMIHSIMKYIDPKTISSEIQRVVIVLKNSVDESVPGISAAVFEALDTARTIEARKSVGLEINSSPVAGLIVSPRMGSSSNSSSYGASNSFCGTMSVKDEHLSRSTGRKANCFNHVNLGSRGHSPMEASRTGDLVGLGSGGWRMARCTMHEQCNMFMVEKNPSHLHQRISRRNSVDNLMLLSSPNKGYSYLDHGQAGQPSLSSNVTDRRVPLISPESARDRGNLLQGIGNEIERRRIGSCHLNETLVPFCEACGGWKRQETMSRDKRCGFGGLNLVLGLFVVMFAIILWVWLAEDQGFPLVPT